jgi:hypothetical protein
MFTSNLGEAPTIVPIGKWHFYHKRTPDDRNEMKKEPMGFP